MGLSATSTVPTGCWNYSHFTDVSPEIKSPAVGRFAAEPPPAPGWLWTVPFGWRCPCETAAKRNFTEGFDDALTLLSPAFSLPTSPGFFSHVPLPRFSLYFKQHTKAICPHFFTRQIHGGFGREGWQMQAEAQAGQGRQRGSAGQPGSLTPRFVRHSKVPDLHPPPHHLLTKPCLRKGFCRLTSDSFQTEM